jgi:CubicO group peptidase (beta-lactamase class C family)
MVLIERGRLVAECYDADHSADSTLPSWSMAKSLLHALVGITVRKGLLDVDATADVPAWQAPDDRRREITTEQLLRMSSGLDFHESYEPDQPSDAVDMLFGSGKEDVARFAEEKALTATPGSEWMYSSGTSNIVSRIVHRALGLEGEAHRQFLFDELFDPIGMRSASPRYDARGTWIGSSFNYATARDFARFGLLYLRDGVWDGRRILPKGWVDHARRETPGSDGWYGAHFWRATDGTPLFSANGFRCQYVIMDPARDLVLVRLGDTSDDQKPNLIRALSNLIHSRP